MMTAANNYSNLEGKTQDKRVLSYDPIKIGEIHYFGEYDRWAGVKRVSDSNKSGLKLLYPNLDFVYIAGSFDNYSLEGKEKRKLDLSFWDYAAHLDTHNQIAKTFIGKLEKEFVSTTTGLDNVIFENLYRGINWIFTKAARNFLEGYDKKAVSRSHDWIINYGAEIKGFFNGFDNPPFDFFPANENVTQTCLTSSIKRQMEEYSPREVKILKNSIVYDDFVKKDDGKDDALREIFLREGIMKEGFLNVAYPVRPDSRKNLEEAVYVTKVLGEVTGKKGNLIIPLPPSDDTQKSYVKEIKEFAGAWGVSVSIGEASKYLNETEFNVGNFYHISDVAVTTAIMGGFEYAYGESQVAGTPLIGRRIREVCEDFELSGMKFIDDPHCKTGSLYDNYILAAGKKHKRRLENLNHILRDKTAFKESIKSLDLEMRLDYANKNLKHNADIIKSVYGHDVVAKDLAIMLKLPGYKKLKRVA